MPAFRLGRPAQESPQLRWISGRVGLDMTDDIPSVFLSYPSQCKGTVQTFADSLRKEKVVVAMAGDLDLLPGLPWTHWIENQLRAARACLVWVEDTGLTPYQERELEYALSLHDHSKKISGTSNVGTYAVIPLIAKRNHEKFRWDIRLHSFQFIDPEDQASVPLIVEAVKVRLHGAVGGRGNDASSLERLFGENPSALGTCPWAPLPPTPHAESQNSVIMSVIPITNEQFGRFERRPTPRSDCRLLPPDRPAVNVSWFEAIRFCSWLETQFRWAAGARPPTVAEWRTAFLGPELPSRIERATTLPIAEAPARPDSLGFFGQDGSFWEWCQRDGGGDDSEKQAIALWTAQGVSIRHIHPARRNDDRGFRVVLPGLRLGYDQERRVGVVITGDTPHDKGGESGRNG